MISHSHVVFAAVLAVGLSAAWPALSGDPLQKAGQELRSAGDKAGHAIEQGVEKAGTAIKKAGQDVGRAVDRVTGKDRVAETGMDSETVGAGASGADPALKAFVEDWSKALVAKDFESWTGYWADDAVLIVPGEPTVAGRADILAFIKTRYASADSFTFSDWRFETIGDLAAVTNKVVWGNERFKQVIVLRETDGAWAVEAVVLDPISEAPS
jgi:ketosteroid isomerase-like protein